MGNSTVIQRTFALDQNYPNPFNPTTTIMFEIPSEMKVVLNVYNILGKKITELVNEQLTPGVHSIEFNGSRLPSGVYFYYLRAGNYSLAKKMLLLK